MGANHAGEVAALVATRAPHRRPDHQRGRRAPRRLRHLEGVARAEGEMVAGLPARGGRGHQRRRRVRGAVAQVHDARARRDLRRARRGGLQRERAAHRDAMRTASSRISRCTPPAAAPASSCTWAGAHNVANALARPPRPAAPALAGTHRRGPRRGARRAGPAAVQADAAAAPGSSTTPTTPTRARCGRHRGAGELDGRRWLVLGDMGELGDMRVEPRRDRRVRARPGVERLFATGPLTAGGRGELRRRRAVVRRRRRHLTAALEPGPRRRRPDVRMLVKGSRFNRLERVVDALTGDATLASAH